MKNKRTVLYAIMMMLLQVSAFAQSPAVNINSLSPNLTAYCTGTAISINFSTVDFAGTNTFTAYMSKSGFTQDSTTLGSFTFSGNQSNASIVYTFQAADADVDSAYHIRIRSGNTVSNSFPASPFSVNAVPVAVASPPSQTICSGVPFSILLSTANNVASTTYVWSRNNLANVSGASSGTGPIVDSVLVNNTSTNQTVTYSITPSGPSPSDCEGSTITASVVLRPSPVITSASVATVCSGNALSLSLSANLASTFVWQAAENLNTLGEDTAPRNTNPLRDTLTNLTTTPQTVEYTIIPTSNTGSCLGSAHQLSVTVNPKPMVTSDTSAAICSGETVIIALSADLPSTYVWRATANASTTGESTTNQTTDSIANTLNNTTTAVQTVVYTITATSQTGGCASASQTARVTVHPKPPANFTIANPSAQCERGNSFRFTATQNAVITHYDWTYSAPLVPQSDTGALIVRSFNGIGDTIPIKLVTRTAYGCTDSMQRSISIYPMPLAAFTVSDTTPCSGDTLTFIQSDTTYTNSMVWTWGDGSASESCTGCYDRAHRYASTSFPSLRASRLISITSRGCRDTSIVYIDVKPVPVVNFSIDNSSQCFNNGNHQFIFTDHSTVADSASNPLSYFWDFGDNSPPISSLHASYQYQAADSYSVKHTVSSDFGCTTAFTRSVTVRQNPEAAISASTGTDTICSGVTLTLSADSGYAYLWSTGETTESISFTGSGMQQVSIDTLSLLITDVFGCSDSAWKEIVVFPSPALPQLSGNNITLLCAGAKAQRFRITNPENAAYTWSTRPEIAALNDYEGSEALIDIPSIPGDTFIIFISSTLQGGGCSASDSISFPVSENSAPVATIINDFNTLICTNNNVVSYQWGYDDANLTSHTLTGETNQDYFAGSSPDFAVSGRYYWVRITDANGCRSTIYYEAPPQYFTGVSSLLADELSVRVHPNPAVNTLQVEFSDNARKLEIYSCSGQMLYSSAVQKSTMSIDLQEWSRGLYFLKISSDNGIDSTIKFIKF